MSTAPDPSDAPVSTAPAAAPRWLRVLGTVAGMFLGGVLVFALYAKLLDPEAFVQQVVAEELDFLLPASWVAGIALALEAVLGFALLFDLRRLRVLIPTAGLVAFFMFLVSRTYYRYSTGQYEDTGSCGCFGNIIERTPAEAFWQDIFLLVPPLVLSFFGRPALPMARAKLRWGLTWGLSAAALGFAWAAPGLPLDDLATRLHPDAQVAELCAGRDENRVCLDHVIPIIGEGTHVVVMTPIDAADFRARLEALNEYALSGAEPFLWVLTPAPQADVDVFSMTEQPAFSLLHAPAGVIRPLYRRLPRSFVVKDGTVTRTIEGWPDLAALAPADPDAGGDEPGGGG